MFFVSQTDGDFKPCSLEFLFQNMYNLLSWKLEDQDPDPLPFSFLAKMNRRDLADSQRQPKRHTPTTLYYVGG
jgi:hypothetical protein